jgi:hypothetical protein
MGQRIREFQDLCKDSTSALFSDALVARIHAQVEAGRIEDSRERVDTGLAPAALVGIQNRTGQASSTSQFCLTQTGSSPCLSDQLCSNSGVLHGLNVSEYAYT